jgi:hypothetical protein
MLDILVIGRGVKVAHGRDIDLSAVGGDARRGELGQLGVERAPPQRRREDQEPDRLPGPAAECLVVVHLPRLFVWESMMARYASRLRNR